MSKMSAIQHTPECIAAANRQLEAVRQYERKWPNYCKQCNGYGAFYNAGYFDHRAGVGEPPSSEPCDGCTFEGLCARCGKEGLEADTGEGPCRFCGWNYDGGLPEVDPCCGECNPDTESPWRAGQELVG